MALGPRKSSSVVTQGQTVTEDEDSYSPHKVVAQMLSRKERKIPNSVFKHHAEIVHVVTTIKTGFSRAHFPYPKYVFPSQPTQKGLELLNLLIPINGNK